MKYLEPRRYGQRILAYANRFALSHLENILLPKAEEILPYPVIFILGPPRCGSTLFVQAVVEALDLSYLSNRHVRWFGAPSLVEKWARPLLHNGETDFDSLHGKTIGAAGPAEAGEWWYRFFPNMPGEIQLDDVSPRKLMQFRNSIAGLLREARRPLIFKNLYASLRLRPIVSAIPEALFIVLNREISANAASIIKTREHYFQDRNVWWSMKPPGWESCISQPPEVQAVEQINLVQKTIKNGLANVSSHRILHIKYDQFCSSTEDEIQKVINFIRPYGDISRSNRSVPKNFPIRTPNKDDRDVAIKIDEYYKA